MPARTSRGAPVHELPRKGLVMVPEGRGIFPQLTVEENLAMGAYARGGARRSAQRSTRAFPRLKERRRQIAGTLSGGEQQMLAIGARADGAAAPAAARRAVDGPRAAHGGARSSRWCATSRRAASPSCWSSRTRASRSSSRRRGYVMESGAIALLGRGEELLANPRVREAYLGEGAGATTPVEPAARDRPAW